ncbi:MAG: ATP-binding protein, partial [Myxococcota bacterium]
RRLFAQFALVVLLSYLVLVLALLYNLRAVRRQHSRLVRESEERKQVEDQLVLARERFDLAVRGSALTFWSWDVATDKLWIDERSKLAFELGDLDLPRGGEMRDFVATRVHEDDRKALGDAMRVHITSREPFEHTMRITRGARDARWLQVRGQAVWAQDGTALRVGGTAADVTEQRGLEEQVRQAQRMESVGMLAGGIAHDFNNLLMVIRSYVEFIDEDFDEGHHIKEYLREIRHAGDRATELTRQLLAYSRQQVIESRPTNVDDLLGRIRGLLRRSIRENINLVLELGGNLPAVLVDPGQTEQVVLNLCINARDAMPEGGELTIETREVELVDARAGVAGRIEPGRYVRMTVRDTGTGIHQDNLDKIFEPFFTTKDIGQGTGLGLSTVIGIVRQQRGGVEVRSEVGAGSMFHVYLPLAQRPASRVHTAELPSVGGSEVVLLAEDEDTVRALAVRVLTRAGYTVLAACDGLQALELFESRADDIDIAVLDVVMPRMSGPTARQRISERRPDLPVLYSTGYSAGELPPDELADANVSVLTKPYRPRLLTSRVRDMLDRTDASGELKAPGPRALSSSPTPA